MMVLGQEKAIRLCFQFDILLIFLLAQMVSRLAKSDFYILPSSIHEVLILRKERFHELQREGKILHEMIRDINIIQLSAEEVLSDYPYFYDRSERKLIQIH